MRSLLFALAALLVFFGVNFASREIIKQKILTFARENCRDCRLEMNRITVSLLRGVIHLEGTHLYYTDHAQIELEARISDTDIIASPLSILSRHVRIKRIHFEHPTFALKEYAKHHSNRHPASGKITRQPTLSTFQIDSVELHDGKFQYIGPTSGKIQVSEIFARVSPFDTISLNELSPLQIQTSARLEDSGRFKLVLYFAPLSPTPHAYIDFSLHNQNLSELNRYFSKAEGLLLKGELVRGKSTMHIDGSRIEGQLIAIYKGLELKFTHSKLKNIASSARIYSDDLKLPRLRRMRAILAYRKKDESLVSFVLRAMKESALKIASRTS